MFSIIVDYPKGRSVSFRALNKEEAIREFGKVVNDTSVLRFELISFEDDQQEVFDALLKIYQNRSENQEKTSRSNWIRLPDSKLTYYYGYEDPNDIYDENLFLKKCI